MEKIKHLSEASVKIFRIIAMKLRKTCLKWTFNGTYYDIKNAFENFFAHKGAVQTPWTPPVSHCSFFFSSFSSFFGNGPPFMCLTS